MKPIKYIFIISAFSFLISCKNNKNEELDLPSCIYQKTDKTPKTKYPFSQADKIEIVSYDIRSDTNDTLVVDGRFIVPDINERIVLNQEQTDSLFSLIYDYKRKKTKGQIKSAGADCYNPRHSIVFYRQNKAFAFLEVCLECGGTRQSKDTDFDYCDANRCMLQDFFINAGVKEGFIREMCH